MYKTLKEIENILENKESITGYKIVIYTKDKNYMLDKPEPEKINTNAIGFTMEEEEKNEEMD